MMKRIIILLLLAFSVVANATTYYVKNGGNDGAAGTSDATAWASLEKVRTSTFSAGDVILFRRGDTFRGWIRFPSSGTSGNHIVIDAYGTGAKPKILNSKDLSATGDWTLHSGNIWKSTATAGSYSGYDGGGYDIGNLFFNGNTDWGRKEKYYADCNVQGDFYFNKTDNLIYIYSTSNPASYYTNIECAGNYAQHTVWFTGKSYITVRNLDAMYSGNNCIYLDGGSHNFIIEYNDVSWVGGWWYSGLTRMGNGIGMWLDGGDQHDHIVRYNRVNQCWDAGISPQGSVHAAYNINMHTNIITNCHYSYETWCSSPNSLVNVDFVNNTCFNAGYSWSRYHREDAADANDSHIMIWTTSGTITNCDIKNNIFLKSRTRALIIRFTGTLKFVMDNNIYYDHPILGEDDDYGYIWEDLIEWRAVSGREANSLETDPLLVSSSDFHLQRTSPAINAGVDVGLSFDFDGKAVPYNTYFDIGAYEWYNNAFYISPTGSDATGDGSISSPYFTLIKAWTVIAAGDTIYMRGGTYTYNDDQYLTGKSGTAVNRIHVFAYPSEQPVFTRDVTFGSTTWPVGLLKFVNCEYIYLKGLEVRGFYQDLTLASICSGVVAYRTHNSIFENLNIHHNGHGMLVYESANSTILNSDFHHNYDPIDPYGSDPYGDGDGLEVTDMGYGTLTTIRGCRFWNNSDDGCDLWDSQMNAVIEDSWSWANGYREDGVTTGGDGNGFKLGRLGSGISKPTEHLRTVRQCMSFYNRQTGFNDNLTYCIKHLYNNISYSNNWYNFIYFHTGTSGHIVRNNIGYATPNNGTFYSTSTVDHNTFLLNGTTNPNYTVTNADFVSLDSTGVSGARQSDGSLPLITFLHLAEGSDLIDTGIDVGLDYEGSYPDLGPFEWIEELIEGVGVFLKSVSNKFLKSSSGKLLKF